MPTIAQYKFFSAASLNLENQQLRTIQLKVILNSLQSKKIATLKFTNIFIHFIKLFLDRQSDYFSVLYSQLSHIPLNIVFKKCSLPVTPIGWSAWEQRLVIQPKSDLSNIVEKRPKLQCFDCFTFSTLWHFYCSFLKLRSISPRIYDLSLRKIKIAIQYISCEVGKLEIG